MIEAAFFGADIRVHRARSLIIGLVSYFFPDVLNVCMFSGSRLMAYLEVPNLLYFWELHDVGISIKSK